MIKSNHEILKKTNRFLFLFFIRRTDFSIVALPFALPMVKLDPFLSLSILPCETDRSGRILS